jgi:XRE family transcriptional regulator, aerobic/anaerobic benzoate catabolism transcriptional regulator
MAKATTNPVEQPALSIPAASDAAFLAAIGSEVRRNRAKRGMTRRQLAQASQTSERYLAQIESGGGNPSVSVLRAIARALDLPCAALLPEAGARTAALGAILDLLAQVPEGELPALAKDIATRLARPGSADRARRIALVGLRGAGKSTLGRMLAQHLGWPFIELDRLVEEDYGASIPDLSAARSTASSPRKTRRSSPRLAASSPTRKPTRSCFAAATRSGSRRGRKIT